MFLSRRMRHHAGISGGLGDIVKAGMDFGTGPLPYDPDAAGAPQNTIPGGASLWVFAGKSDGRLQGRGRSSSASCRRPRSRSSLHQVSGYLPVTMAAYEATKKSGFYDKNPGREIPIMQMMGKAPTENSKGVRLVNLPQVRDIQNEEFEEMLAGKQDAQAGARQRGDARPTRRSRKRRRLTSKGGYRRAATLLLPPAAKLLPGDPRSSLGISSRNFP